MRFYNSLRVWQKIMVGYAVALAIVLITGIVLVLRMGGSCGCLGDRSLRSRLHSRFDRRRTRGSPPRRGSRLRTRGCQSHELPAPRRGKGPGFARPSCRLAVLDCLRMRPGFALVALVRAEAPPNRALRVERAFGFPFLFPYGDPRHFLTREPRPGPVTIIAGGRHGKGKQSPR